MRIVLTGGGTGGHIYPLVAVARRIKEKIGEGAEFLFVGPDGKFEKEAMAKENIPSKIITAGKVRRYFALANFFDPFKTFFGFLQSLWILLWYMPDGVFSKGGYASVPVVIAAWFYRIPVLIHESDAIPGSANRVLDSFAKRIAYSYPTVQRYFPTSKLLLTGNPVREDLLGGSTEEAGKKYNLFESKPVILVLGGSQGSKTINETIVKLIPQLIHKYQIIHQTGEDNYEEVVHKAGTLGFKAGREGYFPIAFMDSNGLRDALAVANLVISRAGANAISEIAAYGKPSILIPLSSAANNHQQMNAFELASIGAAVALEENNLGEHLLMEKINMLLDNNELANQMAEKIKVFYHPDAAEKITEGLLDLIEN
ncbi:MAG: undecaprenyldiphospho-muramoylpentapeptide beta-N-acetylglucosaminyltransferase [Candidatus Moranbacteria bacterium RIFCSPHIGHO2_02_FULL_40_12b]|nr:MAG: undecaprenyldiphospho-muramoylpentapeptide beta-N-acetylglucosaminyltransferase [Candidatus Moranbacteria bacterium RIFCSPHIGHO2_02_FULL_40_12b]OGI23773.1 MAG: undecaprenyldiphospho-muramoylpentapeptide beta-N-acetylglucosaminyltransferase [Candidatus Moranbacteria bacterium RIFCSPHIGHO2_12_FULL_40_10]